ncbi:uncharacterized protein LY89DRAFT_724445 [Mollisia scopiformis]|uniref:2EXR domain-containing protein n=1 Tax=Mollisia scopiformis TaxID=149040 RepID=A0A132BBS8_MOLSC|nr:uncharacterized protein LY89DRAFT_724445 [Mollisia scopiformis]KUJ09459.1 hypothetical protein LY89DRAFT_724445 [Mollisia scopiformis]
MDVAMRNHPAWSARDDKHLPEDDAFTACCTTAKKYSFGLFSQLPTELRLQIWEWAMPERRGREVGSLSYSAFQQTSNCGLPSLLWVNRESRQVSLRMNKYDVRDDLLKQLLPRQNHHFEYIVDYELDTFVFRDVPNFIRYYSALQFYGSQTSFLAVKAELGKIGHLKVDALDPTPDWFSSQIEEHLRLLLPVFPSLQTVSFALHIQVGDASWAELNLESARIIGTQFLEEIQCQQETGTSRLPPRLKLEVVEIP